MSVRRSEAGQKDQELPAGYHAALVAFVLVFCLFFRRYECLFALLACCLVSVVECWEIIAAQGGDQRLECEKAYNIELMVLLPLSMLVIGASMGAMGGSLSEGESAYWIIVGTAMLVATGYHGHYALENYLSEARQADLANSEDAWVEGPCSPDARKAEVVRAQMRLARRNKQIAGLAFFVLIVLVPWACDSQIASMSIFLADTEGFLDIIAAAVGVFSVLSLTIQVDVAPNINNEKNRDSGSDDASTIAAVNAGADARSGTHGERNTRIEGISVLLTNIRTAVSEKLETYRKADTFLTDRFHRTFSEVMVISILIAYFMAKVFRGLSKYFGLYALVVFLAFVVTRLVDFYFHDSGSHSRRVGDRSSRAA